MALISVLLFSMMGVMLTGALAAVLWSGAAGTMRGRSGEIARSIAEAGINATLFKIEAGTNPTSGPISIETYLTQKLGGAGGSFVFTGTLPGGTYAVTMTDPVPGDNMLTLTSAGTDSQTGRTKTLVATLRAQGSVEALNYMMFGNRIQFHNHIKVPYGVTLNTHMWSNGEILIDMGISINGQAQAVNEIAVSAGSNGVPPTLLTPTGWQGDPNPDTSVPTAQVMQVVPAPAIKPFPTFDFLAAKNAAVATGRNFAAAQFTTLIANAQACATAMASDGVARVPGYAGAPGACSVANVYNATGATQANVPVEIVHYKTSAGNPAPRVIQIPNGSDHNRQVPLGSADGVSNPAGNTNLYEIRLVGNPIADNVIFVNNSLALNLPSTTLLQIQGGLIVNGGVSVNAPTEFLAWHNRTGPKFVPLGQTIYEAVATTLAQAAPGQPFDIIYSKWPALAANGSIKLSASGAGNGGPVHVEGVMYSTSDTHIHKSDPHESSYAVGVEIADTIHNCQWFSFAYDPRAANTMGMSALATQREQIEIIRLEERAN